MPRYAACASHKPPDAVRDMRPSSLPRALIIMLITMILILILIIILMIMTLNTIVMIIPSFPNWDLPGAWVSGGVPCSDPREMHLALLILLLLVGLLLLVVVVVNYYCVYYYYYYYYYYRSARDALRKCRAFTCWQLTLIWVVSRSFHLAVFSEFKCKFSGFECK